MISKQRLIRALCAERKYMKRRTLETEYRQGYIHGLAFAIRATEDIWKMTDIQYIHNPTGYGPKSLKSKRGSHEPNAKIRWAIKSKIEETKEEPHYEEGLSGDQGVERRQVPRFDL